MRFRNKCPLPLSWQWLASFRARIPSHIDAGKIVVLSQYDLIFLAYHIH